MNSLRGVLFTLAVALVTSAVITTPVLADDPFGAITNVDLDGNTLTLFTPDGKENEIKSTDATEIITGKQVKITLKELADAVTKAKGEGRQGVLARVTHEQNVATRIKVGLVTTKKAK
jgi:hypothetical protein